MVLLIPADTRPPTLDFPVKLAKAVGVEVQTPPSGALNTLNEPGDIDLLHAWVRERALTAKALIVSLEQLCLGGLVPARRVATPLATALERLEILKQLKAHRPNLRILASGVIVRVAHDDDPLEEKPYYGEYGPLLRFYSETFDRAERYGREKDTLERAMEALPTHILEDWLATRRRNHALHLAALELVKDGVIDHLCLTLDDTSTYGLAAHDRRALEAKTDALGLWSQVDIYPGADEMSVTLLARLLQGELQREPTSVYVRYTGTKGAAAELLYEDRSVGELVKAQLRATGCRQVDTLGKANLVLAVNTPARKQAEVQPDYATVDTPERHLPDFVDFVGRCLEAGKPVSVADIAYPNGAERRLMRLLDALPPSQSLRHLAGFNAWNTAGNTLGGAIATGVLAAQVQDQALWTEVLFNRLVDDYLYQSVVRPEVYQRLGRPSPFDLGGLQREAEELIDALLEPLARALWQEHFAATGYRLHWAAPTLAWPRLFTGVFPFRVQAE